MLARYPGGRVYRVTRRNPTNANGLRAIFTMGLPAAGKSTLVRKRYAGDPRYIIIDPDSIKTTLPGYDPKQPHKLHETSSRISDELFNAAMRERKHNVIRDATATDPHRLRARMDQARDAGYAIHLILVVVPLEVSKERNRRRERTVPDSIIEEKARELWGAFDAVRGEFDTIEIVDTSGGDYRPLSTEEVVPGSVVRERVTGGLGRNPIKGATTDAATYAGMRFKFRRRRYGTPQRAHVEAWVWHDADADWVYIGDWDRGVNWPQDVLVETAREVLGKDAALRPAANPPLGQFAEGEEVVAPSKRRLVVGKTLIANENLKRRVVSVTDKRSGMPGTLFADFDVKPVKKRFALFRRNPECPKCKRKIAGDYPGGTYLCSGCGAQVRVNPTTTAGGGPLPAEYRRYAVETKLVRSRAYDLVSAPKVSSSKEAAGLARDVLRKLGESERERFMVLFFDTGNRLVGINQSAVGGRDSASVHPDSIARLALLLNASAIIVAHNHPSGDAEPSKEDLLTTGRIARALAWFQIKVLDHIVIGVGSSASGYYSVAERSGGKLEEILALQDIGAKFKRPSRMENPGRDSVRPVRYEIPEAEGLSIKQTTVCPPCVKGVHAKHRYSFKLPPGSPWEAAICRCPTCYKAPAPMSARESLRRTIKGA